MTVAGGISDLKVWQSSRCDISSWLLATFDSWRASTCPQQVRRHAACQGQEETTKSQCFETIFANTKIRSRQQVLLQPIFQPTEGTLVFKPFVSTRANLPQEHATLSLAAINLQISVTNEQDEIVHLPWGQVSRYNIF